MRNGYITSSWKNRLLPWRNRISPSTPKEAIKEADRRQKASARRSRRTAKGEMTEEEKQAYREMTQNSYQLSFL